MSISRIGLLALLLSLTANAFAQESPAIIKFGSTPPEVEALLNSPAAAKKTTEVRTTTSVPMFKSNDQKYSSGMFSSTAGYAEFDSYRADEFCYIVSGEATLTAADGTVTKLKAGDAIQIQKGWKGKWVTSGYTKFYVSYSAD
jgi:uncharacterized cupin superfamily protein